MTIYLLISFVAFCAGVGCALAVGIVIERRVLSRPGSRMEVAIRLLDEAAKDGAA
jgi:predicted small secreted protein